MIFKLEHKFIVAVVTTVLLIAAIGYVAHRNLAEIDRRLKLVEITDDLTNTILEMRRSEKNYSLYHDEESLNEVLDYIKKLEVCSNKMEIEIRRVMGDSSFKSFVGNLQIYRDGIKHLINGHSGSKESFELIRHKGRQLYSFAKDLSQKERSSIATLIKRSQQILFGTVWFLLGSGLVAAHFVSRGIVRPLKRIEERTRKIMEGDFTPLPEIKTHAEIQSLTHAFNRMIKDLRAMEIQADKLALLGTLLSGVAHELNNPISNISSSCQILLEEMEEADPDFKRKLLSQIQQQCDKARNIVRSLLEYTRPREFKKESVNLKSLIQDTIGFIIGQMPTKVEMVVSVPDELEIYADKQRVQQAFLNFITNAVDAIPEEGGVITIQAQVNQEKGTVNIKFHDTGRGIEPDVLPKIFDPFYSTKSVGEGTGMGLFITHQIIERHDGNITVESRVGEGTTFSVQLPLGVGSDNHGT